VQAETAFGLIRHAFQTKRLGHAYLIVGALRGAGGELATRVLQMLFCQQNFIAVPRQDIRPGKAAEAASRDNNIIAVRDFVDALYSHIAPVKPLK